MLQVDENPFLQFETWFQEARAAMPSHLVNAMTLATVSADNQPSSRIVLLKEYDEHGFVFYTNYHSRKGNHILENPKVALSFWWETLERQVRIEGTAEKVASDRSDLYFASRPKTSQIAASISQQSKHLPSLEFLQTSFESTVKKYQDAERVVPRPENWGGFLVRPHALEFWQGRENRLHDRFLYTLNNQKKWEISRLFP